ncbi:MAG: hypothetical protein AB1635_14725 [Acidobacteriota bacterium]
MTSRLVMAAAVGLGMACASSTPEPAALDAIAESYVRLALQLAQHQPDLVEAYTGPPEWTPGPRMPVAALRPSGEALLARLDGLPVSQTADQRLRRRYLRGQIRALALASNRLLGRSRPFREEFTEAFGVAWPTVDETALGRARAELDRRLAGPGALADRYAAWRRARLVPSATQPAAAEAAIAACRARTTEALALPPDDGVTVEWGAPNGWEALARPDGPRRSRLVLASDAPRTRAGLARLACHETYPGHHVQHLLMTATLVNDRRWLEFTLTPAFGPHALVSEGAADAGADLALATRLQDDAARDDIFIEDLARALDAAIPDAIADYLDNAVGREATEARLRDALVDAPDAFLRFAEQVRGRAVLYPIGRRVVLAWLHAGGDARDAWPRLAALFTTEPFAIE